MPAVDKPVTGQPAPERATLSANIVQTAQTVITVLESFGEGLRRGGFEQGLPSYRQLADTVVSQRLWALSHQERAADEAFGRIAQQAGRIGGLLRQYVGVMEKLAALNAVAASVNAAAEARADTPAPDRAIVAWLGGQTTGASATKIRSGTGLPSIEITAALARLETRGLLRKAGSTGRFLYTLIR